MKKMSLPHTQKWPQGGARRLIGKDLLQLEAPPPPRGRSQGHAPSPQLPKPRAGENPGTGKRGSGGNQFFLFLQPQPGVARNLDRSLSRCPGIRNRVLEGRDTLPLPRDSLLLGANEVSPTQGLRRDPGGESRGPPREGRSFLSAPPPGAPPPAGGGAFVPHVEPAGPPGTAHPLPTHLAAATWGPGRKRPQPSSTWEGARHRRLEPVPQAPES